jgi:hypothetical protein
MSRSWHPEHIRFTGIGEIADDYVNYHMKLAFIYSVAENVAGWFSFLLKSRPI